MPNKSISQLSAGGAVSGTDLFPDVQTVGVGPVKVTAAQLATYFWTSPTFTGSLLIPAGSSAAPSLAFSGSTNTGLFFPAANTLAFSTAGSERMRITSDGSVGIGVTPGANTSLSIANAPTTGSNSFGVNIDYAIQSSATVAGTYFRSVGSVVASHTLPTLRHYYAAQGAFGAGSTVTNQFGFFAENSLTGATNNYGFFSNIASGTGRWNFYANGTADNFFAGPVQLSAGTAAAPAISRFGDTNTGIFFPAADTIAFAEGGVETMRLDSSGNVGIGTSSPSERLDVNGTIRGNNTVKLVSSSSYLPQVQAYNSSSDSTGPYWTCYKGRAGLTTSQNGDNIGSFSFNGFDTGNVAVTGAQIQVVQTAAATSGSVPMAMLFQTSGSERLRITSSGNVGVGTSSFGTSAATVIGIANGTAPTTGPADTIQIYSTDLSAGNTMLSLYTEGTPVNANTTAAATHRIAIRVNGTVYYLLANTAA